MAGTYPDVPGRRFMYDQDGTLCLRAELANSTSSVGMIPFDPVLTNDEENEDYTTVGSSGAASGTKARLYALVFPEPRVITGLFAATMRPGALSFAKANDNAQYSISSNTTDGMDGTWSTYMNFNFATDPDKSVVRNNISPVNLQNVKGIRFIITYGQQSADHYCYMSMLHIYGTIPPNENLDRVEFWNPTQDSVITAAALDFGDVAPGNPVERKFRVKNLSTNKTATQTIVTRDNSGNNADNNPMIDGLEFSLAGSSSWSSSLTLPTLVPGAISPIVTMRRTVTVGESSIPRWARIKATPTTFLAA